jgi:hypothetical protein
MHTDFQKNFIRMHLLYHANQKGITTNEIQSEINSHGHGYQVSSEDI